MVIMWNHQKWKEGKILSKCDVMIFIKHFFISSMECSAMVNVAALCPGDPGSNLSNSKSKNWVCTNNTSLWSSDADSNHSDCK